MAVVVGDVIHNINFEESGSPPATLLDGVGGTTFTITQAAGSAGLWEQNTSISRGGSSGLTSDLSDAGPTDANEITAIGVLPPNVGANGMTFVLQYYDDAEDGMTNLRPAIKFDDIATNSAELEIYLRSSDKRAYFVADDGTTFHLINSAADAWTAATWTTIIGTIDPSTRVALWVNNVKIEAATAVGTITWGVNTEWHILSDLSRAIGSVATGIFDSMLVLDRAITDDEATQLYNSGDPLVYHAGDLVAASASVPPNPEQHSLGAVMPPKVITRFNRALRQEIARFNAQTRKRR